MARAFKARIRLTVEVPFTAAGETEAQRVRAAVHAETKLVERLRKAIGRRGLLVDALVEEVAEVEEQSS